ncbi:DMT(drug/metabolite transporter) superfamily permease [Synechococcus sp. PCC 7502]|uniref:DMT family transporter n=1 Tax=Synechococcus sp. PCC 7502 TaxID=1173263 RepID=UPI00029F961D|nr:DMT family transporter [Synechococcus sp. PCC 7502]AFY74878.1 DMT(drug/metabolite transporter) superfamily permease [Synechococcus sp. PCC 7502]
MIQISRQSIFVILPFLLWGTAMVVMKAIMPQTEPLFLAAFRLIPSGVLLVGLASFLGRSQPNGWKAWLWIILFGLVDGALFQGFLAFGLVRTNAGLGSLLIDSQPLAVAVMAALFYQEYIGKLAIFGLGIGFIGIGLIGLPHELWQFVFSGDLSKIWEAGIFNLGEWLMLGASLSMAIGTILIRPVVKNADPVAATGWHMIIGGLPLLFLSRQLETSAWQELDAWGWLGMGYISLMGGAIAYGLFFYLASSGNLTKLSALTFSTPVFAIIFGRIFLSETLTQVQWLGVVLTLTSIYLVSIRNSNAVEKADDSTQLSSQSVPSETISQ